MKQQIKEIERCTFNFLYRQFRKYELPSLTAYHTATEIIINLRRRGITPSWMLMTAIKLGIEAFLHKAIHEIVVKNGIPEHYANDLAEMAFDNWKTGRTPRMSSVMEWAIKEVKRIKKAEEPEA